MAIGLSALTHVLATGLATAWLFPTIDVPRITLVDVAGVPWTPPAAEPPPTPSPPVVEERGEAPELPTTEALGVDPQDPLTPPAVERSSPRPDVDLVEQEEGERPPAAGSAAAPEGVVGAPDEAQEVAEEPSQPMLELPESLASGDLEGAVDGSRIALLVRTARVSSSPQAREIRQVIRSVPGFDLYLGESAFDPLTDFRWMMVRTPDPRSLVRTMMVAELAVEGARARATIDRIAPRGERMRWVSGEGYHVAHAPSTADRSQRTLAWAAIEEGGVLAIGPARWVREALVAPERLTGDPLPALTEVQLEGNEPDLVLVADHLELVVVMDGQELPAPTGLVLAMWFGEPSTLVIRAWFESDAAAESFAGGLQARLDDLGQHPWARLIDLPRLVSGLEIQREGEVMTAELSLSAGETVRVLRLAVLLLRGGESSPSSDAAAGEPVRLPGPAPGVEPVNTN